MNFWTLQHADPAAPAVIDVATDVTLTYGALLARTSEAERVLKSFGQRTLGLILCSNDVETLCVYLAALRSGHPVILLAQSLNPVLLADIVRIYRPDWLFSTGSVPSMPQYATVASSRFLLRGGTHNVTLHQDLALLLSTSGSTGSPKLVRLSHRNIDANARAIREYLALDHRERAIASLPMHYSYGLSIINSHLAAGASLVLTTRSVLDKDFWAAIRKYSCTSFAGVPYTYQMLLRFGLLKQELPALRTLTQAGGRLPPPHVAQVHELAQQRGWRFFVMYGQTEATARISYVPPSALHRKLDSIGVPIPGGALHVSGDGELVYEGPNVMMGYAEQESDLQKGDELGGILHTGDLGRCDNDGFFYVTGRRKRFLKVFGQRLNLDQAEQVLSNHLQTSVACVGSDDCLFIAVSGTPEQAAAARRLAADYFAIHHSAIRSGALDALPVTANGKTDYQALERTVTT